MSAFEKHYTIKELAAMWGYSAQSIRRLLHGDAELRALCPDMNNVGSVGKREIHHRRVPESLVSRVYARLLGNSAELTGTVGDPLRVKLLRDRDTRVTQKARNLLKLNALKKLPNSKGIA